MIGSHKLHDCKYSVCRKLTGSECLGCLGSSGVVLDDVDGDFILLSWSKP